jgi:stage III sporulation protein AE
LKRLFAALFILMALAPVCFAASDALEAVAREQADELQLGEIEDSLPGDTIDQIGRVEDGKSLNEGLGSIFESAKNEFTGVAGAAVRTAMKILAAAILCSLAALFIPEGPPDIVSITGVLTVTMIATSDISSLFSLGSSTLTSLSTFSKAILPPLAAITTAAGRPGTAAAIQLVSVIVSDFLITLMQRYFIPLTYLFLASKALSCALKNDMLGKIAGIIKWALSGFLKLVAGAFTAYLTISGSVAAAGDSLTLKAAKLTLSGGVPIVGGVLSDAAGTVLAGTAVIKNSLGVFGLLAVLSVCILPVVNLSVQHFLFKLLSAVMSPVAGGAVSDLAVGISDAFGLMLGMCATGAFLLILSFSAALIAGGAL